MSGGGTWLSHETPTATAQAMVGGKQRLLLTMVELVVIAPATESALPLRVDAGFKVIAPSAISVPKKSELSPRVNCPFICQYTLHKLAPPASKMFVELPVAKAPFIRITKIAAGSPCASKVKLPSKVAAPTV